MRSLTVRERIQLHLFDNRHHADDYEVPHEITQEGIARAVWIDKRHGTQYLRPLMEEGLVRERIAHVKGGRRRRKVYTLTDPGKLLTSHFRDQVLAETVRLRDAHGTEETSIGDVLRRVEGGGGLLEVLRQHFQSGIVQLESLKKGPPESHVKFLAEAPRNDIFVGREVEIAAMTGEVDSPRLFVIRGVSGIGKSSLAAQVCKLHHGRRHIFWHKIRAWDTVHSIMAALGSFLAAMGKPLLGHALREGDLGTAAHVLRDELAGVPATLVFDDAHQSTPNVLDFLRFVKEMVVDGGNLIVLVLTRKALGFYDRRDTTLEGVVKEVDLRGLDKEAVATFLSGNERARQLVALGGSLASHPLFIRLILASSEREAPGREYEDTRRFIEEAIYVDLSDEEKRMMKIASLYEVPIPREALLFDEALSYDTFLTLCQKCLLMPVGTAGSEAHDIVREYFQSIQTPTEKRDFGVFVARQLRQLAALALEGGHPVLAIRYLSNAIQLAIPPRDRVAILEELADTKELVGDLESAVETYREALRGAGEKEAVARLNRKMAQALEVRGRLEEAQSRIEEGIRALDGASSVEQAWLDLVKCHAAGTKWKWEEAREHGATALAAFRTFGGQEGVAKALLELAKIEIDSSDGDSTMAENLLREALTVSTTLANLDLGAAVHIAMAHLYAYRIVDVGRASEHLNTIERTPRALDNPHRYRSFLMLKAWFTLYLLADHATAREYFARAKSVGQKIRSSATVAFSEYGFGVAAYYEGRFGEARDIFERFVEEMARQGNFGYMVEGVWRAAECCLLEGDIRGFQTVTSRLDNPGVSRGVEVRPVLGKLLLGLRHLIEGNAAASIATLQESTELAEKDFEAERALPHFVYGVTLLSLRKKALAEKELHRASELLNTYHQKAELETNSRRKQLLLKTLQGVLVR